jgi:hypothetical protein
MRYLLIVCCTIFFQAISAQVNFYSIPFNEALNRAQLQGKLIFMQFEAADCDQCNEVANKGFQDKEAADKINQTFFCLKIDAQHPDRKKISQDYNINAEKGFGTLFIDNNGTLIHKFSGTTSRSKEYLDQTNIALQKAGENLKINELEKEYKKGNRSFGFLQTLLLKKRTLNLATDSLLEEYVDALPPDSLKSTNTLCFIAQMAPLVDSKAYKVMFSDRASFDRAWYTMSLQMRSGINNVIISKSMNKAIQERNQNYAVRTASFAQGTNGSNYLAGTKARDLNMLRYFDETNDTATYFRKAIAFYERYYLTIDVDSIKKLDSIAMRNLLNNPSTKKDTVRDGNRIRISTNIAFRPSGQNFANELNEGAYKFFQRTKNPYLLSIATEWSKKALELYRNPEYLDTYAKLLYKQNQNDKAVDAINEAIALQQKRGYPTKRYDAVLDAIKNEKPLSD